MKPYRHIFPTLLLSALMPLAQSCTLKNLNDGAPTTIANAVDVVFDWSNAPDTQAGTMVLYLYSEEHDPMNHWFNNPYGGTISSYAGKHTAICHSNDDPYGHHLRNHHDHHEFEIYTDNTALLLGQGISTTGIPRAKGTEDEPLRMTPSMIYGAQDLNIDLHPSNLTQTVTLYPEELVCRYTVEFAEVENLQNADLRIDASISSLAGGYYPGRMSPTSEAVSHTFTLVADDELKSLRSEFYTFGLPDGEELPHQICVYIALKNRTGNFYTFDVSDQVNKAPDPRNVNITIYGLKLPEIPDTPPPTPPEGGMSVEIDTWDIFYFDVKV